MRGDCINLNCGQASFSVSVIISGVFPYTITSLRNVLSRDVQLIIKCTNLKSKAWLIFLQMYTPVKPLLRLKCRTSPALLKASFPSLPVRIVSKIIILLIYSTTVLFAWFWTPCNGLKRLRLLNSMSRFVLFRCCIHSMSNMPPFILSTAGRHLGCFKLNIMDKAIINILMYVFWWT